MIRSGERPVRTCGARWPRTGRAPRRGGVVIIVAISLTVLFGFVAMAFDISYARLMRARLDMALEAASLAAAQELDFTTDGEDRAIDAALAMANRATIVGQSLALDSSNVEFGVWDDNLRSFSSESDAALVNAVRVNAQVNIPLLFGLVAFPTSDAIGGLDMDVSRVATSGTEGGAMISAYLLPFAIPDCYIDSNGDDVLDSGVQSMYFDAGGCATLYDSGHKQAFMATIGAFNNTKMKNGIETLSMGSVTVGDAVGSDIFLRVDGPNMEVSSGVYETLASTQTASGTNMSDGRWSATPTQLTRTNVNSGSWGKTVEGPIMVIDMDDDICTSGSADALAAAADPASYGGNVIGFVWGAVYDFQKRCRQDSTGTQFLTCSSKITSCSTTSPSTTFPSRDRMGRIRFRVDSTETYPYGATAGGPDWGVTAKGSVRLIPQ